RRAPSRAVVSRLGLQARARRQQRRGAAQHRTAPLSSCERVRKPGTSDCAVLSYRNSWLFHPAPRTPAGDPARAPTPESAPPGGRASAQSCGLGPFGNVGRRRQAVAAPVDAEAARAVARGVLRGSGTGPGRLGTLRVFHAALVTSRVRRGPVRSHRTGPNP